MGEQELKEFARLVKSTNGNRVLDLGCGSGVQTKMLLAEDLTVIGLDLSPQMIAQAREKIPKTKFVVGDMTKMKFKEKYFDGIYARASLLHIPKLKIEQVFKEIKRILKPGGFFYSAVKEGKGESEIEDDRYGIKVKRFFSFFQKQELIDILKKLGFKIIRASRFKRTANSTYWIQVLAQKI